MAIEVSEEAGVRYLHFGSSWIQGAMRIARPWSLELDYTRTMLLPLLLRPGVRWPRDVLLVGLGAASLTKFLYRRLPRARLHVVEIDAAVLAAARQFFRLPEEEPPRLSIEIADADDYVARTARRFDLVLVDGFDAHGRAGALDTTRFYRRVRGLLSERGMISVNLLGRSRGHAQGVARLEEAFEDRALGLPRCAGGNVIALGAAGDAVDVTFDDLRRTAAKLRRETGLNLLPVVACVTAAMAGRGDRMVL